MVRLKEETKRQRRVRAIIFQFHYGTIKRQCSVPVHCDAQIFQFHYGTIKRSRSGYYPAGPAVFQFHYGTIKRLSLESDFREVL